MLLPENHPIIAKLKTYPKLWVGLSGGVDSIVLLHALSQHLDIKAKLNAIHVHHGLSKNASQWQNFCEDFCKKLNIPIKIDQVHLKVNSNIEAHARQARYQVFEEQVASDEALILAHHLDDQIETFFLNALRGTGIDGLAAMPSFYERQGLQIFRPLLDIDRKTIEDCAKSNHLSWIEDESNTNTQFSRNFLRQKILPLVEEKWPHYRKNILHTISSCQEVVSYLNYDVQHEQLDLQELRNLKSLDRQIAIRQWFRAHHVKLPSRNILQQIETQMIFAKRLDNQAKIDWRGYCIFSYHEKLYLIKDLEAPKDALWSNYPSPFSNLTVKDLPPDLAIKDSDKLEVRYRKGGEKIYWKGHHRCLKKLMQQWQIPPYLRNRIPLIFVNGDLKAVIGYTNKFDDKIIQD